MSPIRISGASGNSQVPVRALQAPGGSGLQGEGFVVVAAVFFLNTTGGQEGFLRGGPEDSASRGLAHALSSSGSKQSQQKGTGSGWRGMYLMLSGNSQSCLKSDELS